jgi:hypothetical protein
MNFNVLNANNVDKTCAWDEGERTGAEDFLGKPINRRDFGGRKGSLLLQRQEPSSIDKDGFVITTTTTTVLLLRLLLLLAYISGYTLCYLHTLYWDL